MKQLCAQMGISRQAFYKARKGAVEEAFCEELVVQMVKNIRRQLPRLGGRKLYHMLKHDLQKLSIPIGRDIFFYLLKQHRLLVKRTKKYTMTTQSFHRFYVHSNLLKEHVVTRANEALVADITYLRFDHKFCYLFLLTDVYSRKILGYHLSLDLGVAGALAAAQMAFATMNSLDNVIHHSDRGIQYCCDAYTALMQQHTVRLSMGEAGNPYDNAIAERLNGILKTEFGLEQTFVTFEEAQRAVRQAIELYNTLRPHLSLNYMTPAMKYAA